MNPALLVIDVQKGIDQAEHWGGNRNNLHAEDNIKRLLSEWRARNFPVVVIQHCSRSADSPFHPDQPGNVLKDFIFVKENEILIQKSCANAFLGTLLQEKLKKMNVSEVVITGFVTNNSVESTTRMSGEIGFKTVVISDATAAFDKKGLDGMIYSSELVHQISLSNLMDEYASIKTTEEIISAINKESQKIRS